MKIKIAAISDMHYALEKNISCPERHGEHALEFIDAAIARINRDIRPDVLLVGGDLINFPNQHELLKPVAEHLANIKCPMIVIPGNHDPEPEIFYKYLPEPAPCTDICGYRFAIFPDDKQTEHYNCYRSPSVFNRIGPLDGAPLILFQHVPLCMAEEKCSSYGFINCGEVITDALKRNAFFSIGAHFHGGIAPQMKARLPHFVIPSLCENPCRFISLEFEDKKLMSFTTHYA